LSSITHLSASEPFVAADRKRLLPVTGLDCGSAQPCVTNNAGDLFPDQPIDDPGEIFVKPSL
jgi:hypothetical protein